MLELLKEFEDMKIDKLVVKISKNEEHFCYELEMLIGSAIRNQQYREKDRIVANACLEACVFHFVNLAELLPEKEYSKKYYPLIKRANKEIRHLTWDRVTDEEQKLGVKDKTWFVHDLCKMILKDYKQLLSSSDIGKNTKFYADINKYLDTKLPFK